MNKIFKYHNKSQKYRFLDINLNSKPDKNRVYRVSRQTHIRIRKLNFFRVPIFDQVHVLKVYGSGDLRNFLFIFFQLNFLCGIKLEQKLLSWVWTLFRFSQMTNDVKEKTKRIRSYIPRESVYVHEHLPLKHSRDLL